MATNKKLGNTFEAELCEILFKHGFWSHNLAQNAAGQPADVIAVKHKTPYLIDCKVCSRGKFPLSRVEENQHLSIARTFEGKSDPIAYDFVDDIGYLVKSYKKRCTTYRKNGCYFVE